MNPCTLDDVERHTPPQLSGLPPAIDLEPAPSLAAPTSGRSALVGEHSKLAGCLEVVRLSLMAILFPTGVLMFLIPPAAWATAMVFTLTFWIYLATTGLQHLVQGRRA